MNNSNIPPMPSAPMAPGMPDRTVISSGNIDTATGQPVIENNVINNNETIPPVVNQEIPVTYAEPVKFDVPVNEAPVAPVAEIPAVKQADDLLAQPQSPITGTDGPSNEMIKAAEVVYDKEPISTMDLAAMSDQLYPPTQE